MGLVKGEDYVSKPIDMSIYKDYSKALDTNTLQQTPLPAYLNPVPVDSEVFILKVQVIGNGADQAIYQVPSDRKLILTHITMYGFTAVAGNQLGSLNVDSPDYPTSTADIMALAIVGPLVYKEQYSPGHPFVFNADTIFNANFPNNFVMEISLFGYLVFI